MTLVNSGAPSSEDRLRPSGLEDDGLELGTYLRQIWAYRVVIVAVALVCAGSAAAVAMMGGRKYQARVNVMTSVMIGQAKKEDGASAPVPTASLRPLLESKNIAASVIQTLRLDQPPRRLSATTFFADVATIEQVRDSPVISLTVELDDPALAARAANLIAEQAVTLSRAVSEREAARARADLEPRRDEARARMEQAIGALRKFQESSQIELVRKDVESMLVLRGELLPLSIAIETEKAKLATAEKELASRDRANPVYESLDRQIATSRMTLAELERRKTQIVDVRKLDAPQSALLTKVYGLESELARLTVERDIGTDLYREASSAYETARTQMASRSAQLEILDQAVAPDQPVSRHLARNALLGLSVGLVLATLGALMWSLAREAMANS